MNNLFETLGDILRPEQKRNWKGLTITEKLYVKQQAMNKHGKRIHYAKPDYLKCLNELQLITLLS